MTTIKYAEVSRLPDDHKLAWYNPEDIVQMIKVIDLPNLTMRELGDYIWAVKHHQSSITTRWSNMTVKCEELVLLDECMALLDNEYTRRALLAQETLRLLGVPPDDSSASASIVPVSSPAASPPTSHLDEPTSPYYDSWSDLDDDSLAGA
jgi:hypothetical protein